MVEAAGVEPASGNPVLRRLHTYPVFDSRPRGARQAGLPGVSLRKVSLSTPRRRKGLSYLASRRPVRPRKKEPGGR